MPEPLAAGKLLTLLHMRGAMTRAQATESLGLARSAIGVAVDELVGLGLIRTAPAGPAAGRGRPSPLIEPDPRGPVAVAVELRPGYLRVATAGLGLTALRIATHPVPDLEPAAVARQVAELVDGIGPCAGVCVMVPGALREADGHVRSALHLGWNEEPFGARLGERITAPLRFGDDGTLAGLAEYHRGAGRGTTTMLLLCCEHRGIGGSLVNAGVVFGKNSFGVQAGHITVDSAGPRCPCGARGCLELYADGAAMLREAGADPGEAQEAAVARVLAEDAAVVRHAVEFLGAGLAALTNILAPERIVLSGLLGRLAAARPGLLRSVLDERSIVARSDRTDLTAGELAHPVLVGALDRAFAPLLANPGLTATPDR
ncbi:ROK family protein [Amycolatopsis anabasis]|uniref:ROK family protein n=1 Tax=Amycolatopsis anabasis TaxID=1840409 RepID=UPI001FE4D996|nr:ROK family protein [Amycolatopsis anabasis]